MSTMPAAVPSDLAARLEALGVRAGELVRETGKSVTFHAALDDAPVVVKVLLSTDPMWVRHQRAEQDVFRVTEAEGCPVRVARMRYADDRITVLEHLSGQDLHPDRYPGPLPPATVHRVLNQLDRLHQWQPEGLARYPISAAYLDKNTVPGLLSADDHAAVEQLLQPGQRLRVEHGDPHPTNILIGDNAIGVVDLEHLGWHLPGLDWAMIHLLWAPANPWLADHLQQRATDEGLTGLYAVNVMLLACREWRIHTSEPEFTQLEPILAANLTSARAHLHRIRWSLT